MYQQPKKANRLSKGCFFCMKQTFTKSPWISDDLLNRVAAHRVNESKAQKQQSMIDRYGMEYEYKKEDLRDIVSEQELQAMEKEVEKLEEGISQLQEDEFI